MVGGADEESLSSFLVWGLEARALVRQCQYCSSFTMPGMVRELLLSGTATRVSTLRLPDVTIRDQISQAFPFCTCVLQAIKYWRWEWPGNEATLGSLGWLPYPVAAGWQLLHDTYFVCRKLVHWHIHLKTPHLLLVVCELAMLWWDWFSLSISIFRKLSILKRPVASFL